MPGSDASGHTNRLAAETSAYLRQHMHNPVDWFPWGEDALSRARTEDRPLLVSIGYSACHWCHVMERESFEDPETAALMNRLFVNVKVDREERPDVDQLYMDTVVRLTGHGGWPLNVFCTPDGRPFYGGTYFPPSPAHGRPSFRQVLEAVHDAWSQRRDEVEQSARRIMEVLEQRPAGAAQAPPGAHTLAAAARRILQGADTQNGGFGGAPKFPTPTSLDALLAAGDVLEGPEAVAAVGHVVHTCHEISRRGLFDQLGGGFHRYCVDETWTIPHFEKMLYDQGQLLRSYAEAWRRTGASDPELLWPIAETAQYLEREMRGPEGGWYASQDADSEGEEGRFFVWTPEQVEAVLGPERAPGFCAAYGLTSAGNFEGGTTHLVDVAREPREHLAPERAALLEARSRRVAPGTDTKRVTAWNALLVSGLARAGSLCGREDWLAQAAAGAEFLLTRMRSPDGRLLRVFDGRDARVEAFLDDHAALLEACLDLQRAGGAPRFLGAALQLADAICNRFWDDAEGEFFLTPSDGERLPRRPRAEQGGAMPDPGGQAALGLLRTASLSGRAELAQPVERLLRSQAFVLERMPHALPALARAAALAERGVSVAVVIGTPGEAATESLAARARRLLTPEDAVLVAEPGAAPLGVDPTWLAGRDRVDGRPAVHLCRGTACSLPVTEPEALEPGLLRTLGAAGSP